MTTLHDPVDRASGERLPYRRGDFGPVTMRVDRFRVVITQTRHERQNQDELGILPAMEHGISTRVFPDEASALPWLRHGAR